MTQQTVSECKKPFCGNICCTGHPITHVGVRKHHCTECEKSFMAKHNLIIHLRIHSGERPFQCTDCEKNFRTKSYLNIHQRTHSGEKPFQCNNCKKGFIQKGDLNRHQRMHLQDRPFSCTKCGKRFTQKGHLNRHQTVHKETSNISPRERCSQCIEHGGNLNMHSDFHEHQKTHSGERQTQYIECEESLRPTGNQIRHHRTCAESERSFTPNAHDITQQRKHTGGRTKTTHAIMVRLLNVSIPNDYFIPRHRQDKDFQIIEDTIKEK